MKYTKQTFISIICILFTVISGCGTEYQPPEQGEEEEEQQEVTLPTADAVPADGTLKTVTWNLEWYGSGFAGPSDTLQQTKNIIRVVDSLDADLYAFQEVASQRDLNKIVNNMNSFNGFVADFVDQSQKMAIAYNTKTIDSLEAGSIEDVTDISNEGWNNYWAGGRIPLYFQFNYSFQGTSKTFYAVVIHGKANTGDSASEYAAAYKRRKKAAEGLYTYLQNNKPNANIILLGDYNDDVDESIYYEEQNNGDKVYPKTPYYNFVNANQSFEVITKVFSDADESASVNYKDIIDHITMSNELFSFYVNNSADIYDEADSFIINYSTSTSDHYPVSVKFNVTATN